MDNNAGVIYRLFNEAEEQEICETILAYSMLWKHGQGRGLTSVELDDLCEDYLQEIAGYKIDFEVQDALAKLARLGLADIDREGYWKGVGFVQASKNLQQSWQTILLKQTQNDPFPENLFQG